MTEIRTIVNVETGEQIERPLTDSEKSEDAANVLKNEQLESIELSKKAQRQALLDKLGITEDEARLLLGGN